MKNTSRHICCIATMTVVFMIGACHKDTSSTENTITKIIDSSLGKYYCQYKYRWNLPPNYGNDSLIGYDTVTVVKGPLYDQIVLNGETFTYNLDENYYDYHMHPYDPEVYFYNNHDSIYTIHDWQHPSVATDYIHYYVGHRIH